MKIAIGSDHAAFQFKKEIISYLKSEQIEMVDVGTHSEERTHYPVYAERVGDLVSKSKCDLGIVLCGSGIGVSITANKIRGIRCVVCSEPYSAKLSKEHNNTNVLAMGSRVVGIERAKMILDEWLGAEYQGGRHQTRLELISKIEAKVES